MSGKLRYDAARARYLPACEGQKHVAPGMYLGLDARWYVGNVVQSKCPTCGQALPV